MLAGEIPFEVHPFFLGASLALNKKDGGLWPIAVGCNLRRLVAKVVSMAVIYRIGSMLAPLQFRMCDTHLFLRSLSPGHVLLNNFKNT